VKADVAVRGDAGALHLLLNRRLPPTTPLSRSRRPPDPRHLAGAHHLLTRLGACDAPPGQRGAGRPRAPGERPAGSVPRLRSPEPVNPARRRASAIAPSIARAAAPVTGSTPAGPATPFVGALSATIPVASPITAPASRRRPSRRAPRAPFAVLVAVVRITRSANSPVTAEPSPWPPSRSLWAPEPRPSLPDRRGDGRESISPALAGLTARGITAAAAPASGAPARPRPPRPRLPAAPSRRRALRPAHRGTLPHGRPDHGHHRTTLPAASGAALGRTPPGRRPSRGRRSFSRPAAG
jgi:hypothetical protein